MQFLFRYTLFFLLLFNGYLISQNGIKTRWIKSVNDSVKLDSLRLVPGSLLFHQADSTSTWKYNEKSGYLKNLNGISSNDSLLVSYRVFPVDLDKKYFHKDIKQLEKEIRTEQNPFSISYGNSSVSPLFLSDGLTKNGSISRGISFGNNQDLVVNSTMNLQASGKLSPEIDLVLAATDNNIPVQADGNTQQLQEFDKVFVQLSTAGAKLIVGDFQLQRPPSYFMNFYKRSQGIYAEHVYREEVKKGPFLQFKTSASGSISRGRFARNQIAGLENNQGPYRLRGADNELFIIVLSGTERIYIDGRLLTRGQENDYIIDYNTAEITFTAKQIITKDKRIVAEFQYSERNYARTLVYAGEEMQYGKWKAGLFFYQEQDNKNRTFQQTLSSNDKELLFSIGDTLRNASVSGAALSEFNSTEVFYVKKDSLVAAINYPGIFVYTNLAQDSVYRVRFSYVGEGKGNYRQIQSAANGKVYQWYAPVAGVLQGNYEPVLLLATPKKKQMTVFTLESNFSKQGKAGVEAAYTLNDLNTFSPHDTRDDDGQSLKLYYSQNIKLKKLPDSLRFRQPGIIVGMNYEFQQKNFSPIERFRNVEFDRDWNRKRDTVSNDQHILQGELGFELGTFSRSIYQFTGFVEGPDYEGQKHGFQQSLRLKSTQLNFKSSFLNSQSPTLNTQFYRHQSRVQQQLKKVILYYVDEKENNRFYMPKNDSLLPRSYAFWEWESGISNADTSVSKAKVFYRERTDRMTSGRSLKNVALARNAGAALDLYRFANHPIRLSGIYRRLEILDTLLTSVKPDDNVLARAEYNPRFFKGFIQSSLFYEIGYGLEPKREYSFIQVGQGQGQYTWVDYNNNSIKELNEFEIAQYSDQALYVRIFTPTNQYIKTSLNQFSCNVYLRPAVFRKGNSGKFIKFLSRINTQTAYRTDRKTTSVNEWQNADPFYVSVNDTQLIATNYSFRQALFFNQTSAIWGFDYTYQDNRSKQLLTNGFESRSWATNEFRLRWNITRSLGFFVQSQYGEKSNLSELFASRNYLIYSGEVEPKISYQPNTSFRLSILYKRIEKRNRYKGSSQTSITDDYALELRYSRLSKGNLNLRFDYLNIAYNDLETSPIAFEMLNSLKPGENFTWTASYQHNLNSNLQISLNYSGRKTPGNKIIHIGGAEVRAFF